MKFKKVFAFLTLLFFSFPLAGRAYWVWSPEQGKFINPEGAADESTDENFNRAMKLYKDKNYKEAADKIKDILRKKPNAKIAPEALYRLGVIYEEEGDYLKAFKQYQKLVESYPGTERFSEVIERQFRIGNLFFTGKKAKFAGLEILPSLPRAADAFQQIVKTAPYGEYGDKAQFQLGLTYKKMGKFGQAVDALQSVIDHYPQSPLIPQVRYQLAETSFQRSSVESRDQRVLDEAGRQVDRYLKRFPGDEENSEEAAKIRQAIDEKNAEKNYRIGLYYEKENYLDSALIYYADVASRYKQTAWGLKAIEKLKSLKEPADYLNKQEKDLLDEESILRAQIKGLGDQDEAERDRLKRKLERVEQHHKSLGKDKKESIERRREDLARRQRELKQKFKNLDEKRKLLKKNPSEDLKRAIDSWNASLVSEQDDLEKEKIQVRQWSEELGVSDKKFDFIPFLGEGPAPVEKVRRIEAKKLYKLSEEKKSLLEEKELLYKHHNEVSSLLDAPASAAAPLEGVSEADWKKLVERDVTLAEQKQKADNAKKEYEDVEKNLEIKTHAYEKQFGKESWLSSGVGVLEKSLDFINPFDGKTTTGDTKQKISERSMHIEEKIVAEQSIIQTLNDAFNAQLALQEQRRLLSGMQVSQQPTKEELTALRKQLKSLEKTIRADYEDIQDRHKKKVKMLEELDGLLKDRQTHGNAVLKAGQTVASPVVGFAKLSKAFIFGLPEKDVEISKSAAKVTGESAQSPRISELRKEIELDSLIVEAKSREIVSKQKQLEILKAKAALMGGYKFRPAYVKVPYLFIDEAIQSAKRLVPKKEREEMLINRIHEETQKLSEMKKEQQSLEKAIAEVPAPVVAETKKEESKPETQENDKTVTADQKVMKSEIKDLQGQLKNQRKDLKREQEKLQDKVSDIRKKIGKENDGKSKTVKKNGKQEKKLHKELDEIESNLKELIDRESKLESEETSILEKRIQKIDTVLKRMSSKVLSQDLLTERERMEDRLSQIQSRKDFLSKEMDRFRVPEAGAGRS